MGTYGSLTGNIHKGDKLAAHELLRHEYLRRGGFTGKTRMSGNPAIALDGDTHSAVRRNECQLRRLQGLGPNDFHPDIKRELDITQGALRMAGIPASQAKKLRKQVEFFLRNL